MRLTLRTASPAIPAGYVRAPGPVIHDEHVWMDDGNVIVAAGRDPMSLFKCHQSILSKQSEVFRGMFSLPPSDAVEQYQGLPMVHMPDPVEDIRGVLKMLYDPACVACRI